MAMYARMFRSHLVDRFQVSLLQDVLRSCLMEGRQSSSSRLPQVTVIPLALGFPTTLKWLQFVSPHATVCSERLLEMYKTLVRPHLEYAAPVWDPHLLKDINSVENVQKYGLKMCLKDGI